MPQHQLRYEVVLDLQTDKVVSVGFSQNGTYVAVTTEDRFVKVWNVEIHMQFNPMFLVQLLDNEVDDSNAKKSVVTWISNEEFICGFGDGYLRDCIMSPQKMKLNIRCQKVTGGAIQHLVFEETNSCLALCTNSKAKIFQRAIGSYQWECLTHLPDPVEGLSLHPVEITSLAWLPFRDNSLLLSYLNHGVVIWSSDGRQRLQVFDLPGGLVYGGAVCCEIKLFAAINNLRNVDLVNVNVGVVSGERWSPPIPTNVRCIKSIHRGSGFAAGGAEKVELVDISLGFISQILPFDSHPNTSAAVCQTKAIAGFEDVKKDNFLIVTASNTSTLLWKAKYIH